jgi:hypothetical protein
MLEGELASSRDAFEARLVRQQEEAACAKEGWRAELLRARAELSNEKGTAEMRDELAYAQSAKLRAELAEATEALASALSSAETHRSAEQAASAQLEAVSQRYVSTCEMLARMREELRSQAREVNAEKRARYEADAELERVASTAQSKLEEAQVESRQERELLVKAALQSLQHVRAHAKLSSAVTAAPVAVLERMAQHRPGTARGVLRQVIDGQGETFPQRSKRPGTARGGSSVRTSARGAEGGARWLATATTGPPLYTPSLPLPPSALPRGPTPPATVRGGPHHQSSPHRSPRLPPAHGHRHNATQQQAFTAYTAADVGPNATQTSTPFADALAHAELIRSQRSAKQGGQHHGQHMGQHVSRTAPCASHAPS